MPGENQPNIQGEFGFPFSGKSRLFPLPNFVLFPHVVRGLHIFEPRYCAMLEAALETDNLITMATLSDGWEANYQGAPKIHSTVCVGKIIRHQPTEDGRHNILLQGFARGIVIRELERTELYRTAEVQLVHDTIPLESLDYHQSACNTKAFQRIFRCIAKFFPGVPLASLIQQQSLVNTTVNALSYMVAGLLPLPVDTQLLLLGEKCPAMRLRLVEEWLSETTGHSVGDIDLPNAGEGRSKNDHGDFPPNFSLN